MSLLAIATTVLDTECEPHIAYETLDDLRSEVDDRVAAVTELIVTKILYEVLCESHTSTLDLDEVTITQHIDAARKKLLKATFYYRYVQEFEVSNTNYLQYVPSINELQRITFDRFITVADEIRAFVPKDVDLTDAMEFDEEEDFEAFLREQEKMLRRGKLLD